MVKVCYDKHLCHIFTADGVRWQCSVSYIYPGCKQNLEELMFDQASDSSSKGIIGLCSDATAGLFYVYDLNSIFQVSANDEGRDMWKIYLDMEEYTAASANSCDQSEVGIFSGLVAEELTCDNCNPCILENQDVCRDSYIFFCIVPDEQQKIDKFSGVDCFCWMPDAFLPLPLARRSKEGTGLLEMLLKPAVPVDLQGEDICLPSLLIYCSVFLNIISRKMIVPFCVSYNVNLEKGERTDLICFMILSMPCASASREKECVHMIIYIIYSMTSMHEEAVALSLQEEIGFSLDDYNKQIELLKQEMNDATHGADNTRNDISALTQRYAVLIVTEKCGILIILIFSFH
ncbi:hypothetical protein PTKIN_Ptkin10aG0075900 [Pterospermum kingtungense]